MTNDQNQHIWFIMLRLENEIQDFRTKLVNAETSAEFEALLPEYRNLELAYAQIRTWLLTPLF